MTGEVRLKKRTKYFISFNFQLRVCKTFLTFIMFPEQETNVFDCIICPVRHLALSKSYCIFFILLISMQHGLTVQVKENQRKKRITIDAFKQYNPLRLAYLVVCSANKIYRDTHPEAPFLSMLCKGVCFRFLIIVVFSP